VVRVSVATIPSSDRAFRVHVDAALARIRNITPELLCAELRLAYPDATVHVSDALADIGAPDPRWYVYRDRDLAREPAAPEWWWDEQLPRTVLDRDGRYVDANHAAAELFGVDRASIIGAPSGTFTRHEADEDLGRRLFDELARTGELSSTAVVVKPDGTEVPIEFHMSGVPRTDSFTTVMRPRGPTATGG
jgi:PAS domain S-box-containing protein